MERTVSAVVEAAAVTTVAVLVLKVVTVVMVL
jgi:hypothetical protein